MSVRVYMTLGGADLYIGTACDMPTFLSLLEIAKLKNANGVTLYGYMYDGRMMLSGSKYSIGNAFALMTV